MINLIDLIFLSRLVKVLLSAFIGAKSVSKIHLNIVRSQYCLLVEFIIFILVIILISILFLNISFNYAQNEELNTSIDILEKTVERLIRERESLGTVNLRAEEEMNEIVIIGLVHTSSFFVFLRFVNTRCNYTM